MKLEGTENYVSVENACDIPNNIFIIVFFFFFYRNKYLKKGEKIEKTRLCDQRFTVIN